MVLNIATMLVSIGNRNFLGGKEQNRDVKKKNFDNSENLDIKENHEKTVIQISVEKYNLGIYL